MSFVFPARGMPCAFLIAALSIASGAIAGDVRYVDDDAPPGGDGRTWSHAFRHLQDALAAASDPASGIIEVRVAQGVYRPDRAALQPDGSGDRFATFRLISGVALRGGYRGLAGPGSPNEREVDAFVTVLSGDLNGDDGPEFENLEENSINVVTGSGTDATAVLDGFFVTAGFADGKRLDEDHTARGANLWILDGSPTIERCTFARGYSVWNAGGAYNFGASYPVYRHCRFIGNVARDGNGGGMFTYNPDAPDGAGPVLEDCEFRDNSAGRSGGGAAFYVGRQAELRRCTYEGNSALNGGGLWVAGFEVTIQDSRIIGNRAHVGGGGLYAYSGAVTVRRTRLEANVCEDGAGGAVAVVATVDDYELDFKDCTFVANEARKGGALNVKDSYGEPSDAATVRSSIFSGNVARDEGGAVWGHRYGVRLIDARLLANQALRGGAVFMSESDFRVERTDFSGNEAGFAGGACYLDFVDCRIGECSFTGNRAGADGIAAGGAICSTISVTDCRNTLFAANAGAAGGSAIEQTVFLSRFANCTFHRPPLNESALMRSVYVNEYVNSELRNCVVAGSGNGLLLDEGPGASKLVQCLITGGWSGPGSGILDLDPNFVDPDGPDDDPATLDDNDYRLNADSPAIDAGRNDLVPDDVTVDPDGRPRVLDGDYDGAAIVDLGAYEFFPDCNGNRVADEIDIANGTGTDCDGNLRPDSCDVPSCFDISATIYVDPCGFIVGGPLDGLPYFGLLLGTPGDDVIVGTEGPDLIIGLDGEDRICPGAGDDRTRDDHFDDVAGAGADRNPLDDHQSGARVHARSKGDCNRERVLDTTAVIRHARIEAYLRGPGRSPPRRVNDRGGSKRCACAPRAET